MDLYKICEDLINGKVEIKDVINKYKINCFRLIDFIKRYCSHYKISIDDNIKKILDAPLIEILELRKQGMAYNDLAFKYNCSSTTIKTKLIEFCKENNYEIPETASWPKQIELPMKEVYELKKQGMTYNDLAFKYNCSSNIVRVRLIEYCEENDYLIPKKPPRSKLTKLPMKEVYELKKQGMTYNDLATKYKCSLSTVKRRLIEYEEERILRNKYLEILLYDFNLIQEDILNGKTGLFYEDRGKDQEESIALTKK